MNYREATNYLFEQLPMFQRIGPKAFKKDLTNIRKLCDTLGQPEKAFPAVHLAGTNGKGSTAHMIAAGLQEAGYKTGLYTSPHFKDFRERIRINGRYISEKAVVDFVRWMRSTSFGFAPSFFEISVAMAFNYFRNEKVDVAVVETGLGGRLDSTNVVHPVLCVITNIGWDHMNFLGDTLESIAAEKAGIIKKRVPVVVGEMTPETESIFRKVAKDFDAPIHFATEMDDVELRIGGLEKQVFDIRRMGQTNVFRIELDSLGMYQEANLRTALAAFDVLFRSTRFKVTKSAIIRGLGSLRKTTGFMGRWEILGHHPLVIADSAHNVNGLHTVLEQLMKIRVPVRHFVLGFVGDKDLQRSLSLFPKDAVYYFAKADVPRGLDAGSLREKAREYGLIGKKYISVRKALSAARMRAGERDLIFVGGSVFTVAEVL